MVTMFTIWKAVARFLSYIKRGQACSACPSSPAYPRRRDISDIPKPIVWLYNAKFVETGVFPKSPGVLAQWFLGGSTYRISPWREWVIQSDLFNSLVVQKIAVKCKEKATASHEAATCSFFRVAWTSLRWDHPYTLFMAAYSRQKSPSS